MKTEDRYASAQAFIEVSRQGSFTKAAEVLRLDNSSVSRRISALEKRLGVRLLQRSTRRVALTDAGRRYYEECVRLLQEWAEVDELMRSQTNSPRGVLRIALPNTFGRSVVMPLIPQFLRRFPMIDVDLRFADEYQDLILGGIDVAIRIGELSDSRFVARRLGVNHRFLGASPDYLQQAGVPRKPEQLRSHSCLNFSPLSSGGVWQLREGARAVSVAVAGRLQANDIEVVFRAALAGLGIGILADFVARDALAKGRLVRVLPLYRFAETGIFAVYPAGNFLPGKTRCFVDFFAAALAERQTQLPS
jgi:DNA-binding transcriptional LysR family regulator